MYENAGEAASFPTRERGLKCPSKHSFFCLTSSFPTRERGLKLFWWSLILIYPMSFPTRDRGLKYRIIYRSEALYMCRSPRGNVDWNLWSSLNRFFYFVVPHAGTWIEIVQNHLCQCWWGRSPRSNQYPCLLLQIVLNLLRNNRVAGWLTAILYRVKPMK